MKTFLLILLFSFSVFPQSVTFTDISSNYQLPSSVRIFKGERVSPALKLWYLDVNLDDKSIGVRPYMLSGEKLGITAFSQRVNSIAAINGGYFDLSGYSIYSTVVYPDEVKAQTPQFLSRNSVLYPVMRGFFGIKQDRSMAVEWIYHFSSVLKDLYKFDNPIANVPGTPGPAPQKTQGKVFDSLFYGMAGGPCLIKNGVGRITYNEEVMFGSGVELNLVQPRTAIGYTLNNHIIMLVADGRYSGSQGLTLVELKDIMLTLGCYEALNLDGGGSSQMSVKTQLVNLPEGGTTQRTLPTILAVTVADSLNFPKKILFDKVIDTEAPEVQITGAWTPSANSGYYGTSQALLAAIGNGDKTIAYTFSLPKKARYTVQGWWVPSYNRSKFTPYVIKHKNGSDTIKTDQTTIGSKWVTLGEYEFDNAKPYQVIITNKTADGQYVCADAVRMISYDTVFIPSGISDNLYQNKRFFLSNAFPNPFNSMTRVEFVITGKQEVSLKLYNSIGDEVAELFRGDKESGKHSVVFDASKYSLSSGVYFVELINNLDRSTKKLVYLK